MVSTDFLTQFHFLRPIWLLGLLPILILWLYYKWKQYSLGNWKKLINPELISYLTQDHNLPRRYESLKTVFWSLAWLLRVSLLPAPPGNRCLSQFTKKSLRWSYCLICPHQCLPKIASQAVSFGLGSNLLTYSRSAERAIQL